MASDLTHSGQRLDPAQTGRETDGMLQVAKVAARPYVIAPALVIACAVAWAGVQLSTTPRGLAQDAPALAPAIQDLAQAVDQPAPPAKPCEFTLGFAQLRASLGDVVGTCAGDAQALPDGNVGQATNRGQLVWDKWTNETSFTDGNRTWVSGPYGIQTRLNNQRFDWELVNATWLDSGVTPIPSMPVAPPAPSAKLGPLPNVWQTLNNCGPASISEVLGYYGIQKSQEELRLILRPNSPWGMSPYGVPAYAQSIGMKAVTAYGTDELVKALVRNGLPPIVTQWVDLTDHYTHYRPIQAYDDAAGVFLSSDPYLGQNHTIAYADFDKMWSATGGRMTIVYPPDKQRLLDAVFASAGRAPAR